MISFCVTSINVCTVTATGDSRTRLECCEESYCNEALETETATTTVQVVERPVTVPLTPTTSVEIVDDGTTDVTDGEYYC